MCWISLFSKSNWTKTTASRLSYELGVNGEKNSTETAILLIKMGIAHFHIGKPGNSNSLRDINLIWHCYLGIDWRVESMPTKCCGC